MMPIMGEQKTIRETTNGTIGETYSVTVTPGSTWKAVVIPFNSEPVFGDVGKPLTVELQAEGAFSVNLGAMATDIPEGSEPPADKVAIADIVVARK